MRCENKSICRSGERVCTLQDYWHGTVTDAVVFFFLNRKKREIALPWKSERRKTHTLDIFSRNHLLFNDCIGCYSPAKLLHGLISCYHRSHGSHPGTGICMRDSMSSKLAITQSLPASTLTAQHYAISLFSLSLPLCLGLLSLSLSLSLISSHLTFGISFLRSFPLSLYSFIHSFSQLSHATCTPLHC